MWVVNIFFLYTLAIFSFVITCLTFIHFTKFLSDIPSYNSTTPTFKVNSLNLQDADVVSYATKAVVIDVSLLCIFIIQHSSLLPVQDCITKVLQFPVLRRSFLNLLTSASLQFLMYFWRPIPQFAVWAVDTKEPSRQLGFVTVHIVCWLLIYILMITTDITDLLGIKQVFYYSTGRPAPVALKSQQLKDLHEKIRHPSFIGFLLIFWIYPFMRLDRLLLAVTWSLYMALVWRPGLGEYNYVMQQQASKWPVM